MTLPTILKHPLLSLIVALIFGGLALGGIISGTGAQLCFIAAWVAGIVFLCESFSSRRSIGFIFLVGLLTAALLILGIKARPKAVPRYYGTLKPHHELLFSSAETTSAGIIEIGNSGIRLQYTGPQGTPAFTFYNHPIKIERIDGDLKVTTTVTDKESPAILVELVRNDWKVSPPPGTWDRNYTTDALEVRAPDGRIVLQVRVLEDRIQLQGEWWNSSGTAGLRLVGAPGQGADFLKLPKSESGPEIQPIFKYPSDQHLGELLQ